MPPADVTIRPAPAVHFLFCDLASLASVRKFASDFLSLGFPLHVLVNNGEGRGRAGGGQAVGAGWVGPQLRMQMRPRVRD